jgi:integrase
MTLPTNDQLSKVLQILMGADTTAPTFREYGLRALELTSQNRTHFSQSEDIQRYKTLCKHFGDMELNKITPSIILEWQSLSPFAPKTIRNYRGTLNIILNMALCDGYIFSNPLTATKPPKKRLKEVKIFTMEEINALLNATSGQFHNMLQFNLTMGLRGSELVALKWNDVSFSDGTVSVLRRIREGEEAQPKGDKQRVVTLMPQAKEALLKQWELTNGMEYIFNTNKGTPYTKQDTLTNRLRKLCINIGIDPRGMHTIRKTANTLYKQQGMNSAWILQQLGHSSEEVNNNHYTGTINLSKQSIEQFGNIGF